MKRDKAFTIVELMIVVAVIALIVSIAIPSFQSARKSAASTQAIGLLRTVVTLSEQYHTRLGSYPNDENDLINAGMMPDYNASPVAAYNFSYAGAPAVWTMSANPKIPGVTGDNYFFVDQSGVIRFSSVAPATATSTPID